MKKILSFILVLGVMFSCFFVSNVNVSAVTEAKASLSITSEELAVGETTTVTITLKSDSESIYYFNLNLEYDPDILEFIDEESVNISGGAGVIRMIGEPMAKKGSVAATFKAKKAGSCRVVTTDMVYNYEDEVDRAAKNQGGNITVKDKTLSSNANLKSLSVSEGKLSPAFSQSTTTYSVEVGRETTSCKIYATAAESGAKIAVDGGTNLKVGKNVCTVTVTSPGGTQKVYTVNITRLEENIETDEQDPEDSQDTQENSLSTFIDDVEYLVAQNIEGVEIPYGFSENKAIYNGNEVSVLTDEGNNYIIYYLTDLEGNGYKPYLLNAETNTFEMLEYIAQGGRYYIFAPFPQNDIDGYHLTNTEIADLKTVCYVSNNTEFSAFSYHYCFNGEEFGYYRYDSAEKVLQRYPEMLLEFAQTETKNKENFATNFSSLDTNAKIVVIGIFLLFIGILVLIVLVIVRIINHRKEVENAANFDYLEEFDDVQFEEGFSPISDEFDEDESDIDDLDFGDDDLNQAPDYLLQDEEEIEETEE